MKTILLCLATLTVTFNAFAEPQKTLVCKPNTSYQTGLKDLELIVDNEYYTQNVLIGEKWFIAWSESECEDSSSATFQNSKYQDLLSGKIKKASMWYEHSSPAVSIEASFLCELK